MTTTALTHMATPFALRRAIFSAANADSLMINNNELYLIAKTETFTRFWRFVGSFLFFLSFLSWQRYLCGRTYSPTMHRSGTESRRMALRSEGKHGKWKTLANLFFSEQVRIYDFALIQTAADSAAIRHCCLTSDNVPTQWMDEEEENDGCCHFLSFRRTRHTFTHMGM